MARGTRSSGHWSVRKLHFRGAREVSGTGTGVSLFLGMPYFDCFEPHILWRTHMSSAQNSSLVHMAQLNPFSYPPRVFLHILPSGARNQWQENPQKRDPCAAPQYQLTPRNNQARTT